MTQNEGYRFSVEACPQAHTHGDPFRYCGYCGWMEIPEGKFEEKPKAPEKTPDYVFDLIRALRSNETLDFKGHSVPVDVAAELAKGDWKDKPRPHDCIINAERDRFAYGEMYLVGCQCHMGQSYKSWKPGDPAFVCPTSGVVVEDVRTLVPAEEPS